MNDVVIELYNCNTHAARMVEPAAFACGDIDEMRKIGAFHIYRALYYRHCENACYMIYSDGEPIESFESDSPSGQTYSSYKKRLFEMAGIE